MIIKNDQSVKVFHLSRWSWLIPTIGLGVFFILWVVTQKAKNKSTAPPLLYCNAENVKDGQFVNAGYHFSNGSTQSKDYAHSGQYSSKLSPGQGARFGMSYDWKNFQPGAQYEVSIWRRQFGASVGHLVVSGDGPAAFYKTVTQATVPNPGEWEQLQIQFALPPGNGLEKVNIHVYTNGPDSVYFDDLKLVEVAAGDLETFTPRELHLQVDQSGMNRLQQKRAEAFSKGLLKTEKNDWVKARFREGEQDPIPVEIRLKGDWLDHLRGDKWSFRIKCKSGGSWNRMVTFSLHTPAARYFLHEWLLHQLWEKEDILTSRYDFAELFLNGKSLGIYAYEEHFEKQLVEYRERREGPILKFSEAGFWAGIERQLRHHGFIRPNSGHTSMDWANAPIEAFNERELPDNPILQTQFLTAYQRLEQFQKGTYLASSLFDLDLLARYFALSDILQAYHGIAWHNQRFYYNPISDRLEPIGFDGFSEQPEIKYTFLGEGALHPQGPLAETFFSYVFQDSAFTKRYIQCLNQYTEPGYLTATMKSLSGEWNKRLAYLQREFPEYQPKYDELDEHARYIRSLLQPVEPFSLKAKVLDRKAQVLKVELLNTHILPLEIVGYSSHGEVPQHILDPALTLPAHTPRRLLNRTRTTSGRINDWSQLKYIGEESRLFQGLPVFDTIEVPANTRFLFYRPPGLTELSKVNLLQTTEHQNQAAISFFAQKNRLRPHTAYEIQGRHVYFKTGRNQIDSTLFFPPGYTIHIQAGTEIDLIRGARLVSQSSIQATGSKDKPIHIFTSDQSGQGLILMDAEERSSFIHTSFEGLQAARQGSWQLTGAVTVYRSNVRFQYCSFQNQQSEDALNLIRSNFLLDACAFSNNASDGLDSDFCKGEIRNSTFHQMVNDGLDLSGSIVEVTNGHFEHCGDKGISIGEDSDVTILNTHVEKCPIAVACKDLSTAYIKNITLINCRQGFAAFQKKPEFGPGYFFIESHTAHEVGRLYNIAPGSSLQLGERLIR